MRTKLLLWILRTFFKDRQIVFNVGGHLGPDFFHLELYDKPDVVGKDAEYKIIVKKNFIIEGGNIKPENVTIDPKLESPAILHPWKPFSKSALENYKRDKISHEKKEKELARKSS